MLASALLLMALSDPLIAKFVDLSVHAELKRLMPPPSWLSWELKENMVALCEG